MPSFERCGRHVVVPSSIDLSLQGYGFADLCIISSTASFLGYLALVVGDCKFCSSSECYFKFFFFFFINFFSFVFSLNNQAGRFWDFVQSRVQYD